MGDGLIPRYEEVSAQKRRASDYFLQCLYLESPLLCIAFRELPSGNCLAEGALWRKPLVIGTSHTRKLTKRGLRACEQVGALLFASPILIISEDPPLHLHAFLPKEHLAHVLGKRR